MEPVKKYDLKEITIRINNLKKRFGSYSVDRMIYLCRTYSDNQCDVLNLAYRQLKDNLTRIKRYKYGYVRNIEYEKRERKYYEHKQCTAYYNYYSSLYPSF